MKKTTNSKTIKTMAEKINYNDVPNNFLFCSHKACPYRDKCLRYEAMLCIPKELSCYTIVNPEHVAGNESHCTFFKPCHTLRFASGMNRLLEELPYAVAVAIRKELYALMGRSMYYRIRNKQRLLHPVEQEEIAEVFLKHGVRSKPVFDEYIDKYDW